MPKSINLKEGMYFIWDGTLLPRFPTVGKIVKIESNDVLLKLLNRDNTNIITMMVAKKSQAMSKIWTWEDSITVLSPHCGNYCSNVLLLETLIFIEELWQKIKS